MKALASTTMGCLALTTVTAVGVGAPPVSAVEPLTAAKAVHMAYVAWNDYQNGQLSVQESTDRILAAVNAARGEILAHLDRFAASDGVACARSALVNVADLPVMTLDTRQDFANEVVRCVSTIQSRMTFVHSPFAFDDLGFALNVAGPVALLAKARAGMAVQPVRGLLVQANESIVSRVRARCSTTVLATQKPPLGLVRYQVRCTTHDGIGITVVLAGQRPDDTGARREALRRTSQPVALQALRALRSDAARRTSPPATPPPAPRP